MRTSMDNSMLKTVSSNSFIPTAQAARMMTLGFDQLVADCYWLKFIGYIGDTAARGKDRYSLADEYLSLIVSLDPYLINAYWFAAFTIGSEQKSPGRAAEIIDFGIRANQDNWYLPFIAGINQYLYAGNEVAAAKYYRMASKYPDAPKWLLRQSQILEAKIPSRIKEINIWSNIYSTNSDLRVRDMSRQKLIELWGQVIASHPPKEISDKAVSALNELGVNVDFYLKHMNAEHH